MTVREYLREQHIKTLESAIEKGMRFMSIEWYIDVYDARKPEDVLMNEEVKAIRENVIYVR